MLECWKKCIEQKLALPINGVQVFENNGELANIINPPNMTSDSDDSSSSTHVDRPGEEEGDMDTSEVQDDAHGGEESENELEDEDNEEERGEHVYLKQIQEEEVAPVYQLETALGKQITPFIDDSQLVQRFDREKL